MSLPSPKLPKIGSTLAQARNEQPPENLREIRPRIPQECRLHLRGPYVRLWTQIWRTTPEKGAPWEDPDDT